MAKSAHPPPKFLSKKIAVLTLAGSDSGGGAGIQADLRTITRFGLHGVSAITAVTGQNTQNVQSVFVLPCSVVREQFKAVMADFDIRAIKIGMLGNAAMIRCVAGLLRDCGDLPIVLDPILAAGTGKPLLPKSAKSLLIEALFPLAALITPNLPEAEALLGRSIVGEEAQRRAAEKLLATGARNVLLKGGHGSGTAVADVFCGAGKSFWMRHPRLGRDCRGTGCTLSAAIAANLARKMGMELAVRNAVEYIQRAIGRSYRAGNGAWLLGECPPRKPLSD